MYDYTNCVQYGSLNRTCSEVISAKEADDCECVVNFTLEKDFIGKVYMYYGLTNYYQNHRRYVKSRDDDQLLGRLSMTPSSDCAPFAYVDDDPNRPVAPCGAIANSLFSDTFELSSEKYGLVPLLRTEIAWPSDRKIKFRNPEGDLQEALKGFSRPRDWRTDLWNLDPHNAENNGFQVSIGRGLVIHYLGPTKTEKRNTTRNVSRSVQHSSSSLEQYIAVLIKLTKLNVFRVLVRQLQSELAYMGVKALQLFLEVKELQEAVEPTSGEVANFTTVNAAIAKDREVIK